MSLEAVVEANTAAIAELTKAIQGKAATAGGAGKPAAAAAGKPAAAAAGKPRNTAEQVMAVAVRVKNEISTEAAKFLIKKHGAAELKGLKPAAYDAFVAEAEASLEAGEIEGMEDESGGL